VLGLHYVVLAWLPKEAFDAAAARDLAAHLNLWGTRLRREGLQLGYHPHGNEFVPVAGGGTAFDLLVRATQSEDVCFELDVFWAAHAGVDPAALLAAYPDRWRLMHLKDLRKGAALAPGRRSAPQVDHVAVGQGQLDFKALLDGAAKAGVEYYFLEDETSEFRTNIPLSLNFLKAH